MVQIQPYLPSLPLLLSHFQQMLSEATILLSYTLEELQKLYTRYGVRFQVITKYHEVQRMLLPKEVIQIANGLQKSGLFEMKVINQLLSKPNTKIVKGKHKITKNDKDYASEKQLFKNNVLPKTSNFQSQNHKTDIFDTHSVPLQKQRQKQSQSIFESEHNNCQQDQHPNQCFLKDSPLIIPSYIHNRSPHQMRHPPILGIKAEVLLYNWSIRQLQSGKKLMIKDISIKAQEIAKQRGIVFVGNFSWVRKFLQRFPDLEDIVQKVKKNNNFKFNENMVIGNSSRMSMSNINFNYKLDEDKQSNKFKFHFDNEENNEILNMNLREHFQEFHDENDENDESKSGNSSYQFHECKMASENNYRNYQTNKIGFEQNQDSENSIKQLQQEEINLEKNFIISDEEEISILEEDEQNELNEFNEQRNQLKEQCHVLKKNIYENKINEKQCTFELLGPDQEKKTTKKKA